jgi:hypothetical protein
MDGDLTSYLLYAVMVCTSKTLLLPVHCMCSVYSELYMGTQILSRAAYTELWYITLINEHNQYVMNTKRH